MRKDITEVFDDFLNSRFDNLHTCLPGEIVQYYGHAERKAKVKPLIKLRNSNNQLIQIQPIDGVPVVFPSSKTFSMTFPLKKGDGVLLLFSEASMGNFLNNNIEQEADDMTRFSLGDCIAVPGLWSFKNAPSPAPSDNDVIIKFHEAVIKLDAAGNITLNGGTESYIKGDTLYAQLNTILTALQTFTSGLNVTTLSTQASACNTAMGTALGILSQIKSATIKGK